ncbi:unnamed protein product [Gongylonema pulchrum]|uniref:Neurofilament heavy polypeptide-like n=1 Tax=Gongylonema pulchrum TaxID=637853 RepID=A0A183CXW1_9BILA|nr:unnamed protein product [Gongylonema pulchrum]
MEEQLPKCEDLATSKSSETENPAAQVAPKIDEKPEPIQKPIVESSKVEPSLPKSIQKTEEKKVEEPAKKPLAEMKSEKLAEGTGKTETEKSRNDGDSQQQQQQPARRRCTIL